ncbi:MAG: hypothetical protein ACYC5N_06180, partial [Endomicrobiales bacterium]
GMVLDVPRGSSLDFVKRVHRHAGALHKKYPGKYTGYRNLALTYSELVLRENGRHVLSADKAKRFAIESVVRIRGDREVTSAMVPGLGTSGALIMWQRKFIRNNRGYYVKPLFYNRKDF